MKQWTVERPKNKDSNDYKKYDEVGLWWWWDGSCNLPSCFMAWIYRLGVSSGFVVTSQRKYLQQIHHKWIQESAFSSVLHWLAHVFCGLSSTVLSCVVTSTGSYSSEFITQLGRNSVSDSVSSSASAWYVRLAACMHLCKCSYFHSWLKLSISIMCGTHKCNVDIKQCM